MTLKKNEVYVCESGKKNIYIYIETVFQNVEWANITIFENTPLFDRRYLSPIDTNRLYMFPLPLFLLHC